MKYFLLTLALPMISFASTNTPGVSFKGSYVLKSETLLTPYPGAFQECLETLDIDASPSCEAGVAVTSGGKHYINFCNINQGEINTESYDNHMGYTKIYEESTYDAATGVLSFLSRKTDRFFLITKESSRYQRSLTLSGADQLVVDLHTVTSGGLGNPKLVRDVKCIYSRK